MKKSLSFLCFLVLFSSCKINRNSMREANYQLWLHHEDLEFSERITGKASQSKFLGIDWQRTFGRKKFEFGGFGTLPTDPTTGNTNGTVSGGGIINGQNTPAINVLLNGVIGISSVSRVEQMAMYDLIRQNPGYDLVMFPIFQTHKNWYLFGSKTEVVCTAKLGKLKNSK
jgi:hypothetical protein